MSANSSLPFLGIPFSLPLLLLAFFGFLIPAFESVSLHTLSPEGPMGSLSSWLLISKIPLFIQFYAFPSQKKQGLKHHERRHKSETMLLPSCMQKFNSFSRVNLFILQKKVFLPWEGRQKAPHGIHFYSKTNEISPFLRVQPHSEGKTAF